MKVSRTCLCWSLLLLVVMQSWFSGKYAVFAPEIGSNASGNRNENQNPTSVWVRGACVQPGGTPHRCTQPACCRRCTGSPTYVRSSRYILRTVDSSSKTQNQNPATRPQLWFLTLVSPLWVFPPCWLANPAEVGMEIPSCCTHTHTTTSCCCQLWASAGSNKPDWWSYGGLSGAKLTYLRVGRGTVRLLLLKWCLSRVCVFTCCRVDSRSCT